MNLKLIVPHKEDLWFKKEMKEDPATMNYNAGYDLNFEGYNRADGTIQTDLKRLLAKFMQSLIKQKILMK